MLGHPDGCRDLQWSVPAVEELNRHKNKGDVAGILQIVNFERPSEILFKSSRTGLEAPLGNFELLVQRNVRSRAAAGNASPKIIEHVCVEGYSLARRHVEVPYAGALAFRRKNLADAAITSLIAKVLFDPFRPRTL